MLNIALCDDIPILSEVLEVLIHEYEINYDVKFNVFIFDSGEQLLEKFNQNKKFFDLLFLDYHMKRMNGVETALYIRKYNTRCSIVFVTSSDAFHEFMKAAPLEILCKPVEKEHVYKILNKVLTENGS